MEKTGESYNNNLRRVFHFISIACISLIYGLSNWVWDKILPTVSIITLSVILADLLRLQIPTLNTWVQKYFSFILRKHEFYTLSGSSWFLMSALISLTLFPKAISVFGFLCLAVGDPIASYVGISATMGQKIGQKTWYGSGAFFLVTWLVGGLWLLQSQPPIMAFAIAGGGAAMAAIAERILSNFDDNFVIPLIASGAAMGIIAGRAQF